MSKYEVCSVQYRDEFYDITDDMVKIEYGERDIDSVITQQKVVIVYTDDRRRITFPLQDVVLYEREVQDE